MSESHQIKKANKINIGIMGHVDAGKSTLTGHLFYLTKQLTEHEYSKLVAQAIQLKDESFKFAYLADKTEEERKRGVTINTTLLEFKTPNRSFIIADLPGHFLYSKNFINAVNPVNLALLLVSADDGITARTLEHARIVIANGVKRMIVIINKMDLASVNYSESRFTELKDKIEGLLKKYLNYLVVIPLSAIKGENLITRSSEMPWYQGSCLIELLDQEPYPEVDITQPFRVQVSDVYNKTGIGVVVVGNVTRGVLKVNDTVLVKPSNKKGEVKSIEAFLKSQPEAMEGDSIGCVIRGLTKEDVKKGHILSPVDDCPINTVAIDVDLNMIHPTIVLRQASDIIMHYGTGNTAARIEKIYYIKDSLDTIIADSINTNEDSKNFRIVKGNVARVKLVPIKTLAMELARHNFKLGSFTIRNEKGCLAFASAVKLYPHPNETINTVEKLDATQL